MTLLLLIRHGENDVMHRRLAGHGCRGAPERERSRTGRGTGPGANPRADRWRCIPARSNAPSRPLNQSLAARNLQVRNPASFIEVDYGDWQGRTYKQLQRVKLWKTVQETPSHMRFPNGETLAEVQHGSSTTLPALAKLHTPEPDEGRKKERKFIAGRRPRRYRPPGADCTTST
jgi:hypothetical protein